MIRWLAGGWTEEIREPYCQWPCELPRAILRRTPGRIVLDPFCGSGSALVAAIGLGRKVIGIEIDEHYCEIAAKKFMSSFG
jgi:DNA modification methylase